MIRKITLAAVVVLLVVPFGARAEDGAPAAPFDDSVFLKTVVIGGMFDVYLSELVGPETKNSDIKNFAVLTVADHLERSKALKTAAKDAGIELPTKLDDVRQKQYEAFKSYKGDALDRAYVKAMVESHTRGVALFTQASKEAKNPAVKEYATKNLPALEKQLEMAKKLDK